MYNPTTPQERAAYKAALLPERYRAAQAAKRKAYHLAHSADPSRRAAAALTYLRADYVVCYLEELRQEEEQAEFAPSAWSIRMVTRSLGPAYC